MKEVYIVTGTELGWECVVGVYDADQISEEDLKERFREPQYVIHWAQVQKDKWW